jgi:hypothetical protein
MIVENQPRFEMGTSKIEVRSVTAFANLPDLLSRNVNVKIYKSAVLPVLYYGREISLF